jgi:hypothetical protein
MKTKFDYTRTEINRASGAESFHFESNTFETKSCEPLAGITVWHFEEKNEKPVITESVTFWLEEEQLDEIIKDLQITRRKLRAEKAARAAAALEAEIARVDEAARKLEGAD